MDARTRRRVRDYLVRDAKATGKKTKPPHEGNWLSDKIDAITNEVLGDLAAITVGGLTDSPELARIARRVTKENLELAGSKDQFKEEAKAGRLKFWGNWGGPLYSGAYYIDPNQGIDPEMWNIPATDNLDAVYKRHDLFYAYAATFPPAECEAEMRKADQECIETITRLLEAGEITDQDAQDAAVFSIATFIAKQRIGFGYDPPPLRTSDPNAGKVWRAYYAALLGREYDLADLESVGQQPLGDANTPQEILDQMFEVAMAVVELDAE